MAKGKNYFGVRNTHGALITDEEKMTYGGIVSLLGYTEVSLESKADGSNVYADDDVWTREVNDNGFDGTVSVRDDASDTATRAFYATASGYEVLPNGNIEMVANHEQVPVAWGCEEEGNKGGGRKRWFYKCYLGKPSVKQKTTSEKNESNVVEYPISAVPVYMPKTGKRSSGRTSHFGDSNFDAFFVSVPFDDAGSDTGKTYTAATGKFAIGTTYYLRSGSSQPYTYTAADTSGVIGQAIPADTYYVVSEG